MVENSSVDTSFEESVQDDAVQAPEETGNQPQGISEFLNAAEQEGEQPQDRPAQPDRVSGGIKGRLLDADRKGYDRGKSEAEAAWQAEKAQYEARIRKLEELEIKEEATKLAEQEHVSVAFAERLLRAERGIPGNAQPQETHSTEQPRDAQGRFVSRNQQDDSNAYAQTLLDQANTIKRLTGQDMMALYNSRLDIQNRILNREIDFYGLAEEMRGQKQMPPVVRNANGQTVRHRTIADLSDEQFDELDRRLEQGAVFDMRR